jgi:hypothetical protein
MRQTYFGLSRIASAPAQGAGGGNLYLMRRPGRHGVFELNDRVGYPAPHGGSGIIAGRREVVGAPGALSAGCVGIPLEHQASGAPDVDLRYHRPETYPNGEQRARHLNPWALLPAPGSPVLALGATALLAGV